MKKFSMATAGATLLTLMSVSTASAAILSGSGTLSGVVYPVSERDDIGINFFLGINSGDPISGNFSFSYDNLIFNTASDSVEIPLDTFNLSVGSRVLVPAFSRIFPINPFVRFIKSGNSFVFNGVYAELNYLDNAGIPTFLSNGGLFSILDIRTSVISWTSDPDKEIPPNSGFKQTCQGTGCSFTPNTITSVPEATPTLGLLAFGLLGMNLVSKQRKVRKN